MNALATIRFINLDRDIDRRAHMESTLTGMGLPFERFAGIDAAQLTPAQRGYHEAPQRHSMGAGEVACLLGHIEIWKLIADGPVPFGLILEDDVHFAPDFGTFLGDALAKINPGALEIHRFETFGARVTLRRGVRHTVGKRRAYQLETNHGGGAAYLVNRPTARHMLGFAAQFRNAVDIELFDPDRRAIHDVDVLQWMPAPCVQDMINDLALGFKSNVIGDRADERDGILPPEMPEESHLKDMLRPAYTWLYSLALWPTGKWRAHIPFG